jgi:hypothetical protein
MSHDEHAAMLQSRQADLICREVDGSLVGLDLRASHYFSLNAVGTLLWRLLNGGASVDALVASLVEQYDLDHATATHDVEEFIDSLQAQGLLEESAGPAD